MQTAIKTPSAKWTNHLNDEGRAHTSFSHSALRRWAPNSLNNSFINLLEYSYSQPALHFSFAEVFAYTCFLYAFSIWITGMMLFFRLNDLPAFQGHFDEEQAGQYLWFILALMGSMTVFVKFKVTTIVKLFIFLVLTTV